MRGSSLSIDESAAPRLPDEGELLRRYETFRRRYFDDLTPPPAAVRIEWSSRLTSSAGKCYTGKNLIRLSTHYHLKHPRDVDKTLLHEMIHLIVPNHGPQFYAWMERIRQRGGEVERYSKERATPKVHRWLYACRKCGAEARRQRRLPRGGIHHRCGRCGGKLHESSLTL